VVRSCLIVRIREDFPRLTTGYVRIVRRLMEWIPLLSLVALTDDLPGQKLTRGQIGTLVEHLDEGGEQALLVEFSDNKGKTYVRS